MMLHRLHNYIGFCLVNWHHYFVVAPIIAGKIKHKSCLFLFEIFWYCDLAANYIRKFNDIFGCVHHNYNIRAQYNIAASN